MLKRKKKLKLRKGLMNAMNTTGTTTTANTSNVNAGDGDGDGNAGSEESTSISTSINTSTEIATVQQIHHDRNHGLSESMKDWIVHQALSSSSSSLHLLTNTSHTIVHTVSYPIVASIHVATNVTISVHHMTNALIHNSFQAIQQHVLPFIIGHSDSHLNGNANANAITNYSAGSTSSYSDNDDDDENDNGNLIDMAIHVVPIIVHNTTNMITSTFMSLLGGFNDDNNNNSNNHHHSSSQDEHDDDDDELEEHDDKSKSDTLTTVMTTTSTTTTTLENPRVNHEHPPQECEQQKQQSLTIHTRTPANEELNHDVASTNVDANAMKSFYMRVCDLNIPNQHQEQQEQHPHQHCNTNRQYMPQTNQHHSFNGVDLTLFEKENIHPNQRKTHSTKRKGMNNTTTTTAFTNGTAATTARHPKLIYLEILQSSIPSSPSSSLYNKHSHSFQSHYMNLKRTIDEMIHISLDLALSSSTCACSSTTTIAGNSSDKYKNNRIVWKEEGSTTKGLRKLCHYESVHDGSSSGCGNDGTSVSITSSTSDLSCNYTNNTCHINYNQNHYHHPKSIQFLEKEVLIWSGTMTNKKNNTNATTKSSSSSTTSKSTFEYGTKIPIFKGRGIINSSPQQLTEIFLDSDKVKLYNKYSNGRKDLHVFQNDLLFDCGDFSDNDRVLEDGDEDEELFEKGYIFDTSSSCLGSVTKIVESETKVPFTGNIIKTRTLMHARKIQLQPPPITRNRNQPNISNEEKNEENGDDENGDDGDRNDTTTTPINDKKRFAFIILSRSIYSQKEVPASVRRMSSMNHTTNNNSNNSDYAELEKMVANPGSKNELIWGVNILKEVPSHPDKTDLITFTQANSSAIPSFLVQKVGLMCAGDFFKNIRNMKV